MTWPDVLVAIGDWALVLLLVALGLLVRYLFDPVGWALRRLRAGTWPCRREAARPGTIPNRVAVAAALKVLTDRLPEELRDGVRSGALPRLRRCLIDLAEEAQEDPGIELAPPEDLIQAGYRELQRRREKR